MFKRHSVVNVNFAYSYVNYTTYIKSCVTIEEQNTDTFAITNFRNKNPYHTR